MHRTLALQKGGRSVSTVNGQRRILKRIPPVMEYIEKAVQTGIYRTSDEIDAAVHALRASNFRGSTEIQPRVAQGRTRKDIVRGTQVQEYPPEYFILRQHPPIPPPPRVPKKYQRQIQHSLPRHPAEKLVQKALHRQQKPSKTTTSSSNTSTDDEAYYQRLLGVQPPAPNHAMAQKSAKLSRAYAVAMKQYEVMRTQDLSESDALKLVEQLLAEDSRQEAQKSRTTVEEMQQWAEKKSQSSSASATEEEETEEDMTSTTKTASADDSDDDSSTTTTTSQPNLPSILHHKPRVVEGMLQWSRMLQQSGIPYSEWTVGASTALDHWIARNILELSEATWDALLEGDTNDASLLTRGQDIVLIRETLFPETILDSDKHPGRMEEEEEERQNEMRDLESTTTKREKSVDELLASLRGIQDDVVVDKDQASTSTSSSSTTQDGKKDPIQLLTEELQEWRAKNQETEYEQWSSNDKERFSAWLERYIGTLIAESDRSMIDMEETRVALLSSAPQTEQQSQDFWSSLQDETKADLFLQNLLQQGPPPAINEQQKTFWNLSYREQLDKLVNLGAVRPLMDEYMSDEEREDFFRRYGDLLLDGVEMDHLVPDPQGPISGTDLGIEAIRTWNIHREDRFKLVKIPYRSGLTGHEEDAEEESGGEKQEEENGRDAALERSRALYEAWNKHKASRARYEEAMFVQGDLGLSYKSKTANEMAKDRQEQDLKDLSDS